MAIQIKRTHLEKFNSTIQSMTLSPVNSPDYLKSIWWIIRNHMKSWDIVELTKKWNPDFSRKILEANLSAKISNQWFQFYFVLIPLNRWIKLEKILRFAIEQDVNMSISIKVLRFRSQAGSSSREQVRLSDALRRKFYPNVILDTLKLYWTLF